MTASIAISTERAILSIFETLLGVIQIAITTVFSIATMLTAGLMGASAVEMVSLSLSFSSWYLGDTRLLLQYAKVFLKIPAAIIASKVALAFQVLFVAAKLVVSILSKYTATFSEDLSTNVSESGDDFCGTYAEYATVDGVDEASCEVTVAATEARRLQRRNERRRLRAEEEDADDDAGAAAVHPVRHARRWVPSHRSRLANHTHRVHGQREAKRP